MAPRAPRGAARRSVRQSLGSIALGFEVIVVFLGALVVFGLKAAPAGWALGGGAAVVIAMLVAIGLLRYRWGYIVGWILQLVVVASGFLVPMLFIVGIIFTGLWAYCMIMGARLEKAGPPAPPNTPTETENNP